jgi:hypothetical protein
MDPCLTGIRAVSLYARNARDCAAGLTYDGAGNTAMSVLEPVYLYVD